MTNKTNIGGIVLLLALAVASSGYTSGGTTLQTAMLGHTMIPATVSAEQGVTEIMQQVKDKPEQHKEKVEREFGIY